MRGLDVVAVGNVNFDISVKLDKPPKADEKVVARDYFMCLGGAATNFSIACARLGLSCGLLARVGCDSMGDMAIERLRREGVDVSHVKACPGAPTGLALILWLGGPRGIVCCRGANALLSPSDLDEKFISQADFILGASISSEVARALAKLCSRLEKPFILDPGGVLAFHEPPRRPEDVLEGVFIFTPNEVELFRLTGLRRLDKAAELAWSWGPELVVVKAGPEGCFIFDGSSLEHVAALRPRRPVDPTGAGDAFNAGLVLGLLRGLRPLDAARLGVAVATLKLERRGASNMPSLADLRGLLAGVGWHDLLDKI